MDSDRATAVIVQHSRSGALMAAWCAEDGTEHLFPCTNASMHDLGTIVSVTLQAFGATTCRIDRRSAVRANRHTNRSWQECSGARGGTPSERHG